MAAKVVIVAVPTVLSIASIRVYRVSEAPTDGLITREKLNIYTPLPPSGQAQFVPEKPGLIQSGLTTAREGVQPFVQAVKGACLSVKRGSVNLYHTGEDVFYYLKDPPPDFLPRFGTITLAGLLGMFLARKGSRFKRVAVPVGLMSAGASVCYPAQAVAVLKVTGKKVYATGQWSSAALSSLLTPKPQDPVTKETTAASQSQAAAAPNPESSAQSSTITETEVESAESVPASDEPVVASVTEEASSVTITEKAPDQSSAETHTDPVELSASAETDITTTNEEKPVPAQSEEPSDSKQAAEDVSRPAEPTPSLEPETIEAAPAESAPAESAPAESAPAESAPAESAPVESAPAEVAASEAEAAPAESTPAESTAAEAAPVESSPVEVEAAPVEAAASSEEPPTPAALDEPAGFSTAPVESAEPEPAPQSESADPPQVAAEEETSDPTLTPPPQQTAAQNEKGGSGFKPDPAIMDFGQSNPEDEDLYSTRS